MKRGIAHLIETRDGRTKCCHSVLDLMEEDKLFLQFSILSPISESAAPSILVISSIILV